MNRRNFLKTSLVTITGLPFVSVLSNNNEKRSRNSLFTIEELRLWCKMNKFHYVEDNEISIDKYNRKRVKLENEEISTLRGYPFIHKNNPKIWYECLNWNAINFIVDYKYVSVYDIKESTLPFQKEKGEFYSLIIYGGLFCNMLLSNEKRKRISKSIIYDIHDGCWKRLIEEKTDIWWYFTGFKNV